MTDASGLLVVDKPGGWTSHQVVARVRRLLGTRKVGHAGTLDPMATGVLLVGVNRATRLLGHLAGHDKTYLATIRLGQTTVSDDAEGDLVDTAGVSGIEQSAILAGIGDLTGDISQVPSAVSAIKVNGKRAYAMVRAGEEVELKPRQVTVSRFELLQLQPGEAADGTPVLDLDVVVDCTSGTYIRALARDLGQALGSGGHLTALRRTRIGGFDLSLAGLNEAGLAGDAAPKLIDLATAAHRAFDTIELTPAQAGEVRYGRPLDLNLEHDPTALLFDGQLLALYSPVDGRAKPIAVLVGS